MSQRRSRTPLVLASLSETVPAMWQSSRWTFASIVASDRLRSPTIRAPESRTPGTRADPPMPRSSTSAEITSARTTRERPHTPLESPLEPHPPPEEEPVSRPWRRSTQAPVG
ncbi:hypothetical protein [Microbispora sp. GKU 823]|uniref:hypothetical protein n=1 Tax=Microbispora sp. GKU 823 TaxID=1652100 RepID=UPI0009A304D6|nr:hypothetical protein [Microbispora sp. GKU 823]